MRLRETNSRVFEEEEEEEIFFPYRLLELPLKHMHELKRKRNTTSISFL